MKKSVRHPEALRRGRQWAAEKMDMPPDSKLATELAQELAAVLSHSGTPMTGLNALSNIIGNFLWNLYPEKRHAEKMLEAILMDAQSTLDEVYKAEADDQIMERHLASMKKVGASSPYTN